MRSRKNQIICCGLWVPHRGTVGCELRRSFQGHLGRKDAWRRGNHSLLHKARVKPALDAWAAWLPDLCPPSPMHSPTQKGDQANILPASSLHHGTVLWGKKNTGLRFTWVMMGLSSSAQLLLLVGQLLTCVNCISFLTKICEWLVGFPIMKYHQGSGEPRMS